MHAALFLVALIYGSTYFIAKKVMPDYLGPSAFIFIRIIVAAIVFWTIGSFKKQEKIRNRKDFIEIAIAAFFGVANNMLFFFNGLAYTSEFHASVLMLNAPIFVLIFTRLLIKEEIKWWQTAGLIISSFGAFFLIGGTSFQFNGESAKGDVMILINATSFAFYLVYVKRVVQKYAALTVVKYTFLIALFFVLPFAWSELREASFGTFPTSVWISIAYVSIATTSIAYLINAWAVKQASPVVAGSYIYLQPLIATSLAITLGNLELSAEKIIFALLIFFGVYLVNTFKRAQ